MKEEQMYIIVFESTHYAMAGEKLLKDQGYKFHVIPTPREITQSCGLSIKFDGGELQAIMEDMNKAQISIKGIYTIEKTSAGKLVKKLS